MESESSPSSPERSEARPSLPPGGTPLTRLTDHAQGLSSDVRAWLELRYKLAKVKLFEQLDEQADLVVLYAIVGGLAAVGALVMLLAVCFGMSVFVAWIFGWLAGGALGALALGFFLVAVFFFTLAGLVFAAEPRFGLLESKTRAVLSEKRVMGGRGSGERTASASGPDE